MKKRNFTTKLQTALALSLGFVLIFSLFAGLALAQEPDYEKGQEQGLTPQAAQGESYWLILDSAQPVEDVLPGVLERLENLKRSQIILDFDPTPQRSTPEAVPGLQVTVPAGSQPNLWAGQLAGIIAAVDTLPPPPPVVDGPQVQATTGQISGLMTDEATGDPLTSTGASYYRATVYDAVSFAHLGNDLTDSTGRYTLTVTAPYSQVRVRFSDFNWSTYDSNYTPEWYDDEPYFSEADQIDLPEGDTVTNIDAALAKNGIISGTLTDDLGRPITSSSSIDVDVYDATTEEYITYGSNDSSGQFVVKVPPGSYKLEFYSWYGDYLSEWYQDQTSFETATPITVSGGVTTTITAVISRVGSITGTITDAATNSLIEGVDVDIYDTEDEQIYDYWMDYNNGQYSINGLTPGQYKLKFSHPVYQTEYYDDQTSLVSATLVTVNAGETANADAALTSVPTGVITGTITRDGGQPLDPFDEVDIDLYDAATGDYLFGGWPYLRFEGDGVTTTYAFTVAAGEYKVRFDGYDYYFSLLDDEWFNDKSSKDEADVVTLTAGQTTANINADLDSYGYTGGGDGGTITGTLTGAGGNPLSDPGDATVWLYDQSDDWYRQTNPDSNGHYQFTNVATGTDYLVAFTYFPSATTWYDGATSSVNATPIQVTAGVTTTNINGTAGVTTTNINGTLEQLGGCVSGKVDSSEVYYRIRDANGNRIPFYLGLNGSYSTDDYGDVDDDGGLVACGLPSGSYTLQVYAYGSQKEGTVSFDITAPQETTLDELVELKRSIYLPIVTKEE